MIRDGNSGAPHLLVTGAGGFLGRALMRRGLARGMRVTGLTRANADQRDAAALARCVAEAAPDYAIDAAGVVPTRGDVAGNVAMTRGWLDALELLETPPRLVLVGSAAIYGSGAAQDRATRETDPMQPLSDYGTAKLEAMELASARAAAGADVQTGILFNLMGKGQPAHLAPQVFIRKALETLLGHAFEVGPTGAVRDFVDIEDAADALIDMALKGKPGTVANVATGNGTQIGDLLTMIEDRLGAPWVSTGNQGDMRGDYVCYGDPARLKEATGWEPRHTLAEALDRAIAAARTTELEDTRTAS